MDHKSLRVKSTHVCIQLPWLSEPDEIFPVRASQRRRKARTPRSSTNPVELPNRNIENALTWEERVSTERHDPVQSDSGTPFTSEAPSETDSTQPTTPSSAVPQQTTPRAAEATIQKTPTQPKVARNVVPVVPAIPVFSPTSPRRTQGAFASSASSKSTDAAEGIVTQSSSAVKEQVVAVDTEIPTESSVSPSVEAKPAPPKSWADLVRIKAAPGAAMTSAINSSQPQGVGVSKADSLFEVLNTINAESGNDPTKFSFLEPRGLVNTGNMCYMNAVSSIAHFWWLTLTSFD